MQQEIINVLQSMYFWSIMGMVIAMATLISPFFYNGDYSKPVRAIVVLSGCTFFSFLLYFSDMLISSSALTASFILFAVNLAYIAGLYLGVALYNKYIHD